VRHQGRRRGCGPREEERASSRPAAFSVMPDLALTAPRALGDGEVGDGEFRLA